MQPRASRYMQNDVNDNFPQELACPLPPCAQLLHFRLKTFDRAPIANMSKRERKSVMPAPPTHGYEFGGP